MYSADAKYAFQRPQSGEFLWTGRIIGFLKTKGEATVEARRSAMRSYPEVQALALKPETEGGLGVKLHRTTLVRFFDKEREERQAHELAELAAKSDIGEMPDRIALLISAANTRFAQATYELSKANNNPDDFDRLDRALHHMDLIRVKREELANERQRMAEQKRQWEFDAAREVMRNYVEYDKIHRQPNIDEPEKIWQAREIAFGQPPTHTDTDKHNFPNSSPGTAGILPAPADSLSPLPSVQPEHLQPSSLNPHPCADVPPQAGPAVPAGRLPLPPSASPLHSIPTSESVQSAKSVVSLPNSVPASPARTAQSSALPQSVPSRVDGGERIERFYD